MQRRQAASRAPSDLSELAVERHEAEGTSSLQSEGVLRVHFHPGLPVPTVESMTDQLECLWPLSLVVTAMVLTQEAVRFSGRLPVAQLPALEPPAFPPSDALGAGSAGLHALGAVPPPMLPPTQSALYETTVSFLRMHLQQLEQLTPSTCRGPAGQRLTVQGVLQVDLIVGVLVAGTVHCRDEALHMYIGMRWHDPAAATRISFLESREGAAIYWLWLTSENISVARIAIMLHSLLHLFHPYVQPLQVSAGAPARIVQKIQDVARAESLRCFRSSMADGITEGPESDASSEGGTMQDDDL